MTIARIDLPDATYQRAWSVADASERATLVATSPSPLGPKRGDVIYQIDTGIYYLIVQTSVIQQLSNLAALPIALATQVSGVLPTANGGTSVNIAANALPLGSGQIAFPATANPSTDVNTLDDYEEGTWTPTIGGSGGQSGQVYSLQTGGYIKIGKNVWISCSVAVSTLGTITGNAQVKGLPFVVGGTGDRGWAGMYWSGLSIPHVYVSAVSDASGSTMSLFGAAAADNALSNLVQADLSNAATFVINLAYKAAN